ncbi:hypothetical protein Tco_0486780 [Tanacetum coccineum]
MANLDFCDKHNMVAYLQKSEGSEGFHQIINNYNVTLGNSLTESPTSLWSLHRTVLQTASASTHEMETGNNCSTIDGKVKVVSEASIRRHLKLEYSEGISTLRTSEIFEQLALMGSAAKRKDKGKNYYKMPEPVLIRQSCHKVKKDLVGKKGLRLQEQLDEEERQRIARVHEEASTFNAEEWDNIQA